MTTFDIIILLTIIISSVLSAFRGLIRETFSILSYFGGIACAFAFSPLVSQAIVKTYITNDYLARSVSFISVLVISGLVIRIAGITLKRFVKVVKLGSIDFIGGVLFGTLRGIVVIGVLILLINVFTPLKESFVDLIFPLPPFVHELERKPQVIENSFLKDSIFAPYIIQFMNFLLKLKH